MTDDKNVKFINPPNHLKAKAGSGGVPETVLVRAQGVMDAFENDFRPDANKLMQSLKKATKTALTAANNNEQFDKEDMIRPIMQLKANGGMFKYQLITDVADICLQFMESVSDLNAEAIDIIRAHENTIGVIIQTDLRGDGGQAGYVLVQELHSACKRYFKKYNIQ